MDKVKNVPELRFAGFTDDWKQRKLGEIFSYERPDNFIVKSDEYSDKEFTPVLTANKGFLLGFTHEKRTYNQPSIIFDDFTLDSKYVDFPYMVKSSAIKILTTQQNFDLKFAFELLNSTKIETLGHARHYISVVQTTKVSIPEIEEQKAIGEFFKQLDSTIDFHQREWEKYKNLKISYLEKMFPRENETEPKLRFKNFTDPWVQRKAEDLLFTISEKNHAEMPVLSATQDKGMIKRDEVGIEIQYDKKSLSTYKLVKQGQFVIHLRSFQGGFAYANTDGITSPAYTILDFYDKSLHCPFFWREVFKSKNFIKKLALVIYGIRDGRSINYEEFSKLFFSFPTLAEQQAIGEFFRQLDNTITTHQRNLEKLKKLKEGYLQKMFV